MTNAPRRTVIAVALSVASGTTLLAAHPPFGWWWLTFLHPALLLAALWSDRLQGPGGYVHRRRFALGFISGVTAFGPMLSWLIAPAGWIGWALLVVSQSAWMGLLALLLAHLLTRRWFPLFAAALWTGVDAWRAVVPLSGFEWGTIAYAHASGSWMLPLARIVGGRGITFVVVLVSLSGAVVGAMIVQHLRELGTAQIEDVLTSTRLQMSMLVGGLLLSILVTIEPPQTVGSLDVLVVQGNDIRHWEDPAADPSTVITTNLRDETLRAIGDGIAPDLTVWPESSIDRDPTSARGASLEPLVRTAVHRAGELIAGATMDGPDPAEERYITALQFRGDTTEVDRYVKRRLVPFGEYVPIRPWLDWFPPLEQTPRDAIAGGDQPPLTTASGVRIAVAICFETLFGEVVRSNILAGDSPAQVILALTNDASFREGAEPAQHLAQSQLRAVETGRWVVHGSLSGSSAFIDPRGEVHDATPLFERTSIRRDVPLAVGFTPFLRIGDVLGVLVRIVVLVMLVSVFVERWGRTRRSTSDSSQDG